MTTVGLIGSGDIGGTVARPAVDAGYDVVLSVDTVNYDPRRDGQVAELGAETTTTSELVQAHLPGSRVVKAFNDIQFGNLARLARLRGERRATLPVAGDDDGAKRAVVDREEHLVTADDLPTALGAAVRYRGL